MADKSAIEWTDATWNPVRGCSRVSPGCGGGTPGPLKGGCYAERMAARFSGPGQAYEGLATFTPAGARWTGAVRVVEAMLFQPLAWSRPRRIFVNSMSDLFHENLALSDVDRIVAVMAMSPQHTFQVLTKRAARMRDYFNAPDFAHRLGVVMAKMLADKPRLLRKRATAPIQLPLPNLWGGVSVEDQQRADERVSALIATRLAVRFLSCEPLLGPVRIGLHGTMPKTVSPRYAPVADRIHWVICGGESQDGARPMHPAWARALRDECVSVGVPFFFKQWGEWVSVSEVAGPGAHHSFPDGSTVRRVGKKAAGRELDGRTWDEFPVEVSRA
ncbi:DUF5131 family protein [Pyxidicoccus caerfyrddinensis]|uniref:DUF5131 family protein n=1 Tax=Pyxidicoccus caerfyrddinensis TaxID=2709663 RepID=UPI0013DAE3D0|nr:phage Gp37/Gp68 family protein [Pyxidicoccus caerfyrddinensis]